MQFGFDLLQVQAILFNSIVFYSIFCKYIDKFQLPNKLQYTTRSPSLFHFCSTFILFRLFHSTPTKEPTLFHSVLFQSTLIKPSLRATIQFYILCSNDVLRLFSPALYYPALLISILLCSFLFLSIHSLHSCSNIYVSLCCWDYYIVYRYIVHLEHLSFNGHQYFPWVSVCISQLACIIKRAKTGLRPLVSALGTERWAVFVCFSLG